MTHSLPQMKDLLKSLHALSRAHLFLTMGKKEIRLLIVSYLLIQENVFWIFATYISVFKSLIFIRSFLKLLSTRQRKPCGTKKDEIREN